MKVLGGDGNDKIRATAFQYHDISAGPGNDVVLSMGASPGINKIVGGPGADLL